MHPKNFVLMTIIYRGANTSFSTNVYNATKTDRCVKNHQDPSPWRGRYVPTNTTNTNTTPALTFIANLSSSEELHLVDGAHGYDKAAVGSHIHTS